MTEIEQLDAALHALQATDTDAAIELLARHLVRLAGAVVAGIGGDVDDCIALECSTVPREILIGPVVRATTLH